MNKSTKASGSHALVSRWTRVCWVVAVLTAVGLILAAWRLTGALNTPHPSDSRETVATPQESPPLPVTRDKATAFYQSEITPLLDAALRRNRQAADRAIESLHERFNAHRAGVKPFAEDVSGWSTRFGVIGCFAIDLWDRLCGRKPNANRVGQYIQGKFRAHVLSERSLQTDVEEVLKQFREDVEANRNQLFAEIKLPLRSSHSPVVLDDKGLDDLCSDITERAKQLNAATPHTTVVTGLASLVCGWIGSETAEVLVAEILSGLGSALAAETAETATVASGSALVGGTATGGGFGSLGGPAGTAIGVGVGLIVGVAIDWWMSNRLEAHMTEQCKRFLDIVEHQLVDGAAGSPGLRASFKQAVILADQTQRKAVIDVLKEARK